MWTRLAATVVALSSAADAQKMPMSDTEDASIGSISVGNGRFHPVLSFDVRNGDFVRGSYDDDAANLDRLPVHLQLGVGLELHRDTQGKADVWLEVRSSNGFHSPIADERASPRGWYESNNLVGLVAALAPGLNGALTYTIKASPNGIADTTHEVSTAFAYAADRGIGMLRPGFVATIRTKGGGGPYAQVTIEPEIALTDASDGPTLSVPAVFGVGIGGFYEEGSGTAVYGSAGVAYSHPFTLGNTNLSARAEVLALVRDDRLRRLGDPLANKGTIQPYATVGLTLAY